MRHRTQLLLIVIGGLLLPGSPGFSQSPPAVTEPLSYHYQSYKYEKGLGIGVTASETGDASDRLTPRVLLRPFFRYRLFSRLQGVASIGIGQIAGNIFSTVVVPIEHRFVLNILTEKARFTPFAFAGVGLLGYHISSNELQFNAPKRSGFVKFVPAGFGIKIRLTDRLRYTLTGGVNRTFSGDIDGVVAAGNDSYYMIMGALSLRNDLPDLDSDEDGLKNKEEKKYKTDKLNPDTDNDGLKDGAEVKEYASNPINRDTDGDQLTDGDEVTLTHTSLTKPDTDGDQLNDGDEVNTHKTDPNQVDTDADVLNDYDEVMLHHTNPMIVDTDGDGLKDGEEVVTHHTDPMKNDTDGGSVDDGKEVAANTNPLVASDDVSLPASDAAPTAASGPETQVPGKVSLQPGASSSTLLALEPVLFKVNSYKLSNEARVILDRNYQMLKQNPTVVFELQGYTDFTDSRKHNKRLSVNRAKAVRDYLIGLGIDAGRIKAITGFGEERPVAPNDTKDGRQQNRRVELLKAP